MKWIPLLMLVTLPVVASCAPTQKQVDTAIDVVKDADSLAQRGCEIFYADTFGISFADAAKFYCKSDQVKEFRKRFLSASQEAGAAIGAAPPAE